MTEFIENIFSTLFGNNVILATILIAVVPVIELKGAIPFSMSPQIWGAAALPYWEAFLYGLIGSSMVVPILALLYIPIINWLKKTKLFKRLAEKLENRVNSKKEKLEEKAESEDTNNSEQLVVEKNNNTQTNKKYNKKFFLKLLGVFAFVAIPLPLTGVWTGTCIGVALGLGFWWTCASVILGNVVAGLLITLVSSLFGDATLVFFYILIAVILIFVLVKLLLKLIKRKKEKQNN